MPCVFKSNMIIIGEELVQYIASRFTLDTRSNHGPAHWMRVRKNGLILSELTDTNTSVVELFALLHDSCRLHDGGDVEHGPRAAEFSNECYRQNRLPCDWDELQLLTEACEGHTTRQHHDDPTIATCWDADRLDLWRVGIWPDPGRLSTKAARNKRFIEDASTRAREWVDKTYRY